MAAFTSKPMPLHGSTEPSVQSGHAYLPSPNNITNDAGGHTMVLMHGQTHKGNLYLIHAAFLAGAVFPFWVGGWGGGADTCNPFHPSPSITHGCARRRTEVRVGA
eukprot:scaffold101992_cov16-Tisochrysis_lutea.AAC.2